MDTIRTTGDGLDEEKIKIVYSLEQESHNGRHSCLMDMDFLPGSIGFIVGAAAGLRDISIVRSGLNCASFKKGGRRFTAEGN